MATTREQAVQALFDLLKSIPDFKAASRRLRTTEAIEAAEMPALFLVEHEEDYAFSGKHQPPIRMLTVLALVYTDVGQDENVIPAAPINAILDAIDAKLKPGPLGRCTLNGLVAGVEPVGGPGLRPRPSGDITGKSLGVYPIAITLP